jgi:hypothetical protein
MFLNLWLTAKFIFFLVFVLMLFFSILMHNIGAFVAGVIGLSVIGIIESEQEVNHNISE